MGVIVPVHEQTLLDGFRDLVNLFSAFWKSDYRVAASSNSSRAKSMKSIA